MKEKIKTIIKENWITITFILTGAIAGYIYWFHIGCTTGTCPLKSIWYYNVLTGSIIGYLIGSSVSEKLEKNKNRLKSQMAEKDNKQD